MWSNKIIGIIFGVILIAGAVGGYFIYAHDTVIRDIEREINMLQERELSAQQEQKEVRGVGSSNQISKIPDSLRFGGRVISISENSLTFNVKSWGQRVFDDFQGERVVLITDSTVFEEIEERPLMELTEGAEIHFEDLKVNDVITVVAKTGSVSQGSMTAQMVTRIIR